MANQAIDDFLAESEELLEKLNQDLAELGDAAATRHQHCIGTDLFDVRYPVAGTDHL